MLPLRKVLEFCDLLRGARFIDVHVLAIDPGVVAVPQDQLVFPLFVREEVENSLFFHQPGREMQGRLVVLGRGLARLRLRIEAKRGLGHACIVEDRLEDVFNSLVEE